jgi:pyruvate kinase
VLQPHKVISALRVVIDGDKNAIVASRLFDSLAWQPVPVSADITDAGYLLEIGYRTFMLGDQICMKRDSVIEALNLLEAIAGEFE